MLLSYGQLCVQGGGKPWPQERLALAEYTPSSCYALIGHPELSTSNQLVFSWFSPDDRDGYAHVRIGAVGW